jgi:hypothetical protein
MTQYERGKIYMIQNVLNDEVYIGSTCNSLGRRMTKHRYDCKKGNSPFYKMMLELGIDKFYIELIENYPCDSKQELHAREGYWIKQIGTIEQRIAGRPESEWREENKEILARKNSERYYKNHEYNIEQRRAYHNTHKEEINAKNRELEICECGLVYTHCNRLRHFKSNRHKKQTEKQNDPKYKKCECGELIYHTGMARHLRGPFHKKQMEFLESKK